MNIGFDLDGIFVDKPILTPKFLIEWLFREQRSTQLRYRWPGKLEQEIRKISHFHPFRQALSENIEFVREFHNNHSMVKLYLISARFSFLQQQTKEWIRIEKIASLFKEMIFNNNNLQPHIFKKKIIVSYKIDHFIDDDLPLLEYLSLNTSHTKFYWLTQSERKVDNITPLQNLKKLEMYL